MRILFFIITFSATSHFALAQNASSAIKTCASVFIDDASRSLEWNHFLDHLAMDRVSLPDDSIVVHPETVLFRGIRGTLSAEQIENLFTAISPLLSSGIVRNNMSEASTTQHELNKQIQTDIKLVKPSIAHHTSGILMQNTPWVSATHQIGIANYFSYSAQNDVGYIVVFKAGPGAISIKNIQKKFWMERLDRQEAEVVIPGFILPENILYILEMKDSDNGIRYVNQIFKKDETDKTIIVLKNPIDHLKIPLMHGYNK